ncbi:hypothetical protein WJX73_008797 [Symbiochloris irregularis]|uniref:YdbS-like PH domain-containing protein n=1 Tax=Symbiochloris irregularis TaxID=706552 RepID=A0AAW1PW30_9CHLO
MDRGKQEPLLDTDAGSDIVWEGTTWQGFSCAPCFAPLCCSVWKWRITSQRIDLEHGCCGSDVDSVDLRRVIDIHFHRSLLQMCLNRGTITIHSSNDELPQLNLTTFGTKELYHDIKDAWTRSKQRMSDQAGRDAASYFE